MTSQTASGQTYEQFKDAWLTDIEEAGIAPLEKGRRFATKLVTQWLNVTEDDDDFVVCDGSGDGGIDIGYLKRSETEASEIEAIEGDTWYLVQSKYGSSFSGNETIVHEANKVLTTLEGGHHTLSDDSKRLLDKINLFIGQASEADRIVLVFATLDPITPDDRNVLDYVQSWGRGRLESKFGEHIGNMFSVEEVSLATIWEVLPEEIDEHLTVSVKGDFIEHPGLLIGAVSLVDLYTFLKDFRHQTGNLDQLYQKNVRQFLGGGGKINKKIAETLKNSPEKFGLYNNGITIAASSFTKMDEGIIRLMDPYVVNGCQTTKTIWQVLDVMLNAGGTGATALEDWRKRLDEGGVVTKIVQSSQAEIANITRYTNSQNAVREKDFVSLEDDFQVWKRAMQTDYDIFLEIQRGGITVQKALEKQHPTGHKYSDYVNAFDLVKVYGAGWLSEPGTAFSKNPPFLPTGDIYKRMIERSESETPFGAADLYAAYHLQREGKRLGLGRSSGKASRRLSKFLFYHVFVEMVRNVITLTPEILPSGASPGTITHVMLKLARPESANSWQALGDAAGLVIDTYLTPGSEESVSKEDSYLHTHGSDLNAFLKSSELGKPEYSPVLIDLLGTYKAAFAMTQREQVANDIVKA